MSDLRWLFIDFNAYFVSAEQQDHPELRDKPVAVTHILVDTGTLIAVSYEARAFGVQAGMRVTEARALCPSLQVVASHEKRYVEYHHRLIAVINACLPITAVLSIDEVIGQLPIDWREESSAWALAQTIKAAIADQVGSCFRCSIGVAPNRYLAKIVSEFQKPDGFSVLHLADLPDRLYALQLRDLPGIGEATEKRLSRQGILSVEALYTLSLKELRRVWGSIAGEHMYRWLRGEDTEVVPPKRQSIGHSHVLAPAERHREAAHTIAQSLLVRAALRLRVEGYWTKKLWLYVQFGERLWEARATISETQGTSVLLQALEELWEAFPTGQPTWISISLHPLISDAQHHPLLFEDKAPQKTVGPEIQGRTPARISFSRIPTLSEWRPAERLVKQTEHADHNEIDGDNVV